MPRHQNKNTITARTISPLEPSYSTTVYPEYCSIAEGQDTDLKVAFKNMIEVLNEAINKSLKNQ